jgi:hypothetical protein
VRNRLSARRLLSALLHAVEDVEVIQNVLQTTVVGQPIEKSLNLLLGTHLLLPRAG